MATGEQLGCSGLPTHVHVLQKDLAKLKDSIKERRDDLLARLNGKRRLLMKMKNGIVGKIEIIMSIEINDY